MAPALVIVAYNDEGSLEACVASVRHFGYSDRIVIVDNASNDETGAIAHRLGSTDAEITVVVADSNRGYAGGFNLGVASVDADFVAVMNADCTVQNDWISTAMRLMEQNDRIAAVCPTIGLAGGMTLNAEGLTVHKAGFGFNRHLGRPLSTAAREPTRVGGVQGTAFAARRSALDRIGGWSTNGFLYHEDVELSWALTAAGFEIWHAPTPPVLHDYALTMSPEKFFLLERNRWEMIVAYLGIPMLVILSPLLVATEAAVWFYALRKRGGLPAAKWRSYRSALSRRPLVRTRRRQIAGFRVLSDRALIKRMAWGFPTDQTLVLHQGVPSKGRRGGRDMPLG